MRSLLRLSLLQAASSSFTSGTLSDVGEGRAVTAGMELPMLDLPAGGELGCSLAPSAGVQEAAVAEPLTSSPLSFLHSAVLSETSFCFLLRPISAFLLSPVEDACTFWRLKGQKGGSSLKIAAVELLVGA